MTADTQPVEELEGRELDAAVAMRVMGWRWYCRTEGFTSWFFLPPETPVDADPETTMDKVGIHGRLTPNPEKAPKLRPEGVPTTVKPRVPHYSTDIAAAWEVWGQLPESWALIRRVDGRYRCVPGTDYRGAFGVARHERGEGAIADTAPLAICRAALRAVRDE